MAIDTDLVTTFVQVGGIAGVGCGLLMLIFKDVIRRILVEKIPTLTKVQSYNLIKMLLVFPFLIAVLCILAWLVIQFKPEPEPDPEIPPQFKFRAMLDECKGLNYRQCDDVDNVLKTAVMACKKRLEDLQANGNGQEIIRQSLLCDNISTVKMSFDNALSKAKSGCLSNGIESCSANTDLIRTIGALESTSGETNIHRIAKSYGGL